MNSPLFFWPSPTRLPYLDLQCLFDLFPKLIIPKRRSGLQAAADSFELLLFNMTSEQFIVSSPTLRIISAQRKVQFMRPNHRIGCSERIASITAPAVHLGTLYHLRPHRIEFDIPTAGKKIPLFLNQTGLESPLPQGAGSPVGMIDIGDIPATDMLQQSTDRILLLRGGQQVDVVGHENVGMYLSPIALTPLPEPFQISPIVAIVKKDRLAIVAALYHMHGNMREEKTGFSRHLSVPMAFVPTIFKNST